MTTRYKRYKFIKNCSKNVYILHRNFEKSKNFFSEKFLKALFCKNNCNKRWEFSPIWNPLLTLLIFKLINQSAFTYTRMQWIWNRLVEHINLPELHKGEPTVAFSKNQNYRIQASILQDVTVTDIRVSRTGGSCQERTITNLWENVQCKQHQLKKQK